MPSDPTPPESNLNPSSTNFLTGVTLTEPPVSRTKGRKSSSGAICAENSRMPNNPYSTYSGSQGKRECQIYHVRGHYSTTCPQNPDISRAAENKAMKRGAKTQSWAPRKKCHPRIKKVLDDDKDEGQSEEDDTKQFGCTEAMTGSASNLALARIRRASTCRVDYRDKSDLNDYESE